MILPPNTTAAYPGIPAAIITMNAKLVLATGSPFAPVSCLIQLGSSVMPPQLPIIIAAATTIPTIVDRLKPGRSTSTIEPGVLALTDFHRSDSGTWLRITKTHAAGNSPNAKTQRQE